MENKINKIESKVWEAINSTINKFRENPYYFFTESDIISYFYYRLYTTNHEQTTRDEKRIYLVHREYPTNFKYDKDKLLNEDFIQPYPLDAEKGQRGNYDLAILDPVFVQNADSEKDIVNKDLRFLRKRIKNNEYFKNSKELLFAFEFKYITNNAKVNIKLIKEDNKKLFFAIKEGGAKKAINLVFCNNDYHYLNDLKETIKNTGKEVLSILIQSYFDDEKKITPRPLMSKEEPRVK